MAVLMLSVHLLLTMPASPTPYSLADLSTYLPQTPARAASHQKGSKRHAPLPVFMVTDELIDVNSPYNCSPPPASGSEDCRTSCLLPAAHSGESLQDLASDGCVRNPYPLNHRCLCHWLRDLSLVLKLGEYRPCRPEGCSPTDTNYHLSLIGWVLIASINKRLISKLLLVEVTHGPV